LQPKLALRCYYVLATALTRQALSGGVFSQDDRTPFRGDAICEQRCASGTIDRKQFTTELSSLDF
jgi:hypothetical protein